jgi:hypothetical protein
MLSIILTSSPSTHATDIDVLEVRSKRISAARWHAIVRVLLQVDVLCFRKITTPPPTTKVVTGIRRAINPGLTCDISEVSAFRTMQQSRPFMMRFMLVAIYLCRNGATAFRTSPDVKLAVASLNTRKYEQNIRSAADVTSGR